MARPQIAVVGTGSMGSLHARVLHNSPRADLAVVVEPREEIGRSVADRFGASWAPDLSGVSGVDAVVVAAATGAHHRHARHVNEAGLPQHVENPLAHSQA